MTYEQFYERATKSLDTSGMDVAYLVCQYDVRTLRGLKRQHYPEYETIQRRVAICNSLAEAEAAIQKMMTHDDYDALGTYCFKVEVFVRNIPARPCGALAWFLYDNHGRLIDHSVCRGDCEGDDSSEDRAIYWGRSNDMIRFKPGDIVEVAELGGNVSLAVVAYSAPSVEYCWKVWNNWPIKYKTIRQPVPTNPSDSEIDEMYFFDDSDDCYTLLEGCGYMRWHSHVNTQHIFAPHFPIPPYLRRKVYHWYEYYLKENEKWEKELAEEKSANQE